MRGHSWFPNRVVLASRCEDPRDELLAFVLVAKAYSPNDYRDRLRSLREERLLSQSDIEQRTGLFRCYVSRVGKWPHRSVHRNTGKDGARP